MTMLRTLLAFLFLTFAAHAAEPIKIGDVNSYGLDPKSVSAYENGVKMAVEEINAGGGVLGRPLQYLLRDDKGNPGKAITATEELVQRDHVDMLAGAWYNATAAAVGAYANKNRIPFLATFSPGDKIVGVHKTPFVYSLWPTTRTEVSGLLAEAVKSGIKTWAIVVPTFDDGLLAQDVFKKEITSGVPGAKVIYEHRYEGEKLNATALLPVLMRKNPDGILFVGLPSDVTNFVREGNARGWLQSRKVFSLWNGYPDVRDTIGAVTPDGWIVTGYPVEQLDTPAHTRFVAAYRARFHEYPTYGATHGYIGYKLIAQAITKAGSTDHAKVAAALSGIVAKDTPLGDVRLDPVTHQSTVGAFVGTIGHDKTGRALMTDWHAVPPAELQ